MKKFKFYYNGMREVKATSLAFALIKISKAFTELKPLTPKELINETNIIEL